MEITRRGFLRGVAAVAVVASLGWSASGMTAPRDTVMLGETPVRLVTTGGRSRNTMIALHQNESTSVSAGKKVLARAQLIELRHSGGREVKFTLKSKRYVIDPNRIFTEVGIKNTLRGNPKSPEVYQAVKNFAREITSRLSGRVIALHNNTNGSYSILSYLGPLSGDAAAVSVNPKHDPDDFFLVTERSMFEKAKRAGYNVLLQSSRAKDDGSLSIYCMRQGIPYVNVEAQNGHTKIQIEMLQFILS